jgi:hypothetical protein
MRKPSRDGFSARVIPKPDLTAPKRAWGMPGTTRAPAASRAKSRKHTSKSPRVRRNTRHSRTRMVLTAYGALSPAIGLSCRRRQRNAKHCRQLDASVETSGPHAFAVREPRRRLFRHGHVHRIPAQRFVTTAKRPSCGPGRANL